MFVVVCVCVCVHIVYILVDHLEIQMSFVLSDGCRVCCCRFCHMTQVEAAAGQDLVGPFLCLEESVLVGRTTLCSCLFSGLWQQQVKAHL